MHHQSTQRGTTRTRRCHRVRVRETTHYNVIELQDVKNGSTPPKRLSPSALWILLAYLPPSVRARPWVRHLVKQQLARIEPSPDLGQTLARHHEQVGAQHAAAN